MTTLEDIPALRTLETRDAAPTNVSDATTRRRRKGPRSVLPRHVEVAVSPCGLLALVPLQGAFGRGKTAIVEREVWEITVAPAFGTVWAVNWGGGRKSYQVCRSAPHVARAARQRGPRPKASLARLISGAGPGFVVLYRDGDPLNLRRSNLEVVMRGEHLRRLRDRAR